MTWGIEWSRAARASLLSIPMRYAERVDAAIVRYAATGRGNVARVDESLANIRLFVPPYVAYVSLDFENRVMWVRNVYPKM